MAGIPGIVVGAPIVTGDTLNIYASHYALYGKGGYRSVASAAERNAIPNDAVVSRLETGMLVYEEAGGAVYQLQPGWPSVPPAVGDSTTNADWAIFGGGGTYTFTNGLTLAAGVVRLGGSLTGGTTITTGGNELWVNSGIAIGSGADADNTLITIKNGAVGVEPALLWKANYIGTTQDALVMSGPTNVGMNLSVFSSGREANLEAMNDTLTYGSGLTLGLRGASVATSLWWRFFRDNVVNKNQLTMSYHHGPAGIDNDVCIWQPEGDLVHTVSKTAPSLIGHHLLVTSDAIVADAGDLIGQKITVNVPNTIHKTLVGFDVDIQMQDTSLLGLNRITGINVHNLDNPAYYHGGQALNIEGAWRYGINVDSSASVNAMRVFNGAMTQEKDDSSIYGCNINLTDATSGTGVSYMIGYNIDFNMRAGATQTVRAISIDNNDVAAASSAAVFYVNGTWDYAFQFVGTFGSIFNIGPDAVPAGYSFEALTSTGGGIKIWNTASAAGNYYGLWVKNAANLSTASLDGSGGAIYGGTTAANGAALVLEATSSAGDAYLVYGETAMHGIRIESLGNSYAAYLKASGTPSNDMFTAKVVTDLAANVNDIRLDGLVVEHDMDMNTHSGIHGAALTLDLVANASFAHTLLFKSEIISAGSYRTGLVALESYDNVNDQPFCIFRGNVTATENALYFGGGSTGNADMATDIIFRTAAAVGTSEITGITMASIDSLTFNHDRAMSLGSEWYQSVVSTGDTLPLEYSYVRVGGDGAAATLGNGQLAISITNAVRGQIMVICGTDDTYPVTMMDNTAGSGLNLNGDAVLGAGDTLTLIYSDVLDTPVSYGWVEIARTIS